MADQEQPSLEDISALASGQASETIDAEGVTLTEAEEDSLDRKARRDDRKTFSRWTFKLVCYWLGAVIVVLLAQGFTRDEWWIRFRLDDSVLIAFTTSTTVAVLGLLATVIGDLFPLGKRRQK